MKKCIFKCENGICGRSTSPNHCKVVTEPICSICDVYTDSLGLSTEQKLKNAIKKAIQLIEANDESKALRILQEALSLYLPA